MLTPAQFARLAQALPLVQRADDRLARDLAQSAAWARIPAGRDVFVEGDAVDAIALLLSGVVRVYKLGESGREITLYRFGLGESCILTANAILSQRAFPAIATVEAEAEAVLIPASLFRQWVGTSDLWRSFLFDLLSQRLASVMALVEEIAFRRMDARLAALLLERAQRANPIAVTHQALAAELGSSREVISRLLEDFSAAGLIRLSRGRVEILQGPGLEKRAAV